MRIVTTPSYPVHTPSFSRMNSMDPECLYDCLASNKVGPGDGAWPAAGLAMFMPLTITTARVVTAFSWHNGTVISSDNRDVGIYDLAGNRIVSLGGVTSVGGSLSVETFSCTPTIVPAGTYFLAMVCNGTGQVSRFSFPTTQWLIATGMQQQTAGAYPLPATATLVNPTNSYVPIVGLTTQGVA